MSPRAVFIGMPGAGKSTVGRAVAHALALPFADSDSLIIQRTGKSVQALFEEYGEEKFRAVEADVIAKALRDFGGILALGGGSVLSERTQQALASERVIMIDADDAILADRVTHSHTVRPLLQADPHGGIARLRAERGAIYRALAKHIVHSSISPASDVAQRVIDLLNEPYSRIDVGGSDPYSVTIGRNLVQHIVQSIGRASAVLIVYAPEPAVADYAQQALEAFDTASIRAVAMELPRAESAKNLSAVASIWDAAGEHQIGRDGAIVAIGGGATTDVGGFAAATWLRGIPFVTVPTSLLGMVDAAVGGKTGINTSYGKNLVGAFYPPKAVVCDMDTLRSLPESEIRAGLGEVIKCGFIRDRTILEIVAEHGAGVLQPSAGRSLQELIHRSIAVKADVVSQDLKESGLREILNYGHTLAHAIELREHYQMRHGEAVAIGCVFAAALSEALGIAPAGFTDLHRSAFAAVGLPISYSGASRKELIHHMHSDKKVRGGQLRFVVLSQIGEPTIALNPNREVLSKAFEAIGC